MIILNVWRNYPVPDSRRQNVVYFMDKSCFSVFAFLIFLQEPWWVLCRCLLCRPSYSATKNHSQVGHDVWCVFPAIRILINMVFSCFISICSEQKKKKKRTYPQYIKFPFRVRTRDIALVRLQVNLKGYQWAEKLDIYLFCWASKLRLSPRRKLLAPFLENVFHFRGLRNMVKNSSVELLSVFLSTLILKWGWLLQIKFPCRAKNWKKYEEALLWLEIIENCCCVLNKTEKSVKNSSTYQNFNMYSLLINWIGFIPVM